MSQSVTSQKLGFFGVIVAGLLFAWFAGNDIADENLFPIAVVLGGLFSLTVIFGLGRSVYLLIPITWGMTGKISVLPLPFDVRQLVVLVSSGLFISDLIFKKRIRKQRYQKVDILVFANLLYLSVTFLLHPVGVAAIGGGDRVGGRPYLDVLLGLMAYLILSRQKPSLHYIKRLPVFCLSVALFSAFAGLVGRFLPAVGAKLAYFYSEFAPGMIVEGNLAGFVSGTQFGQDRMEFLLYPGTTVCLFVVSQVNPAFLIRPEYWRSAIFYICGVLMVMLSGFRDGLINIVMTAFAASFLREKFMGIVKILFFVITIVLGGIVASYADFSLPYTFQRALAFLPGNWDVDAVASAKDSSEWRIEMWKEVIKSDKYIRNKIFGDGFGIPREDYEKQLVIMMSGGGGGYEGALAAQEAFMINGDFHNGPLTVVRCMGVVGLFLFIPLTIAVAFYAYRMIMATHGTPFQTYVLYVGIGLLVNPVIFLFVFGDFKAEIVNDLFAIGLLNMISTSFDDYLASRRGTAAASQ